MPADGSHPHFRPESIVDRYVVWLHEGMGVDRELNADEWVILKGNRMVAAIPY